MSIVRRPIAAVLAAVATTTVFLVINFLFEHTYVNLGFSERPEEASPAVQICTAVSVWSAVACRKG